MKYDTKFEIVVLTLALLMVAAALLLLGGCGLIREETTKETQVEQVVTRSGPMVADTPIGQVTIHPATVTVDRRQTTDTRTDETRTVQPPDMSAAAPIVSGLAGLIPGVGGLVAAGVALWSRQKAMGALKATVDGIEEWRATANPVVQKELFGTLAKRMDAAHKQLIRKAKS